MANERLTLSQAIRKGSEGREQMYGDWYERWTGSVCAITAAFVAIEGDLPDNEDYLVWVVGDYFPELVNWIEDADGDSYPELSALGDEITVWNDDDKLTFEEIATKLEAQS
jgi:hypothetical protein